MVKKPRWIIEETQALRELYPVASKSEIKEAIPDRTWHAITTKAKRMGINRKIPNRNPNGTFKQIRKRFSLDNFNDGYIDNRGRFRVWVPDHPRAYEGGYILRSIVAYETYHGVEVPKDAAIHHVDGNRLNDSKENLEMMSFSEHSTLHNKDKEAWVERICLHCGCSFLIERWRLKDPSRGKFCSQKCYHDHPRSKKHKQNISKGLKKTYEDRRRVSR